MDGFEWIVLAIAGCSGFMWLITIFGYPDPHPDRHRVNKKAFGLLTLLLLAIFAVLFVLNRSTPG
jgi:hypothetical protein